MKNKKLEEKLGKWEHLKDKLEEWWFLNKGTVIHVMDNVIDTVCIWTINLGLYFGLGYLIYKADPPNKNYQNHKKQEIVQEYNKNQEQEYEKLIKNYVQGDK